MKQRAEKCLRWFVKSLIRKSDWLRGSARFRAPATGTAVALDLWTAIDWTAIALTARVFAKVPRLKWLQADEERREKTGKDSSTGSWRVWIVDVRVLCKLSVLSYVQLTCESTLLQF